MESLNPVKADTSQAEKLTPFAEDDSGWPAPGLQPAVEASEGPGEHHRHEQDARPEDKRLPDVAQVEVADATDEQIADREVE